jgi:hypothetical protein
VIVAGLLIAGCFRGNICGGSFEVYELAEYLTLGENVIHLTEKDFANLPELSEVMRGEKRTNAACRQYNDIYGHFIGGSYFDCNDEALLGKYLTQRNDTTMSLKAEKFLEYDGKYYYMRITRIS